jgi:hypothetical protein
MEKCEIRKRQMEKYFGSCNVKKAKKKKINTSNLALTFFLIRFTYFFQMIASELSE